jgi:hypothetical protein
MGSADQGARLGWRIWVALGLGVLMLAAAPFLRLRVTPVLAQSPEVPPASSFTSSGTITTLLDFEPEPDQPANQAPIPVTRTLTTTGDAEATAAARAEGRNVAVTSTLEQTLTSDGRLVAETQYRLAADRSTQALEDCCQAEVSGVEFSMAGAGSPLRLPWFAPPRTYPYLDTTLLAPVEMAFIGWDRVEDLDAMKFQQSTAPTSVGMVPVPGPLVGSDQPTVRLARTYTVNRTLWVDRTTGIILRTAERVRETLRDDAGKDILVLLAMSLASTPEQDAAQVAAARQQARPVLWAHAYGPLLCILLGSLLLLGAVIGIVMAVRARRVEEDFPDELRTFDDLKEAFD